MKKDVCLLTNHANLKELLCLLYACDEGFIPKLSKRVSIDEYAKKIFEKSLRFEAWKEFELVGLIAVYCNDFEKGTAFITSVSVLPKYQGLGIGNRLMDFCVDYIKKLKFSSIELEVASLNLPAITLYKKFGFTSASKITSSEIMVLKF